MSLCRAGLCFLLASVSLSGRFLVVILSSTRRMRRRAMPSPASHPGVEPNIHVRREAGPDRQSHDARTEPSKLFTAALSASQSHKVLPEKDMLSFSLSRRDQGSQRQPRVEDAVGATLSRSWQENVKPCSSEKPHKLHIFRKTDRNWKLQLCLIGGEEQKENLAPRRNAERGNVSSALEPFVWVF